MRWLWDCSTAKMGGAKTYREEFLKTIAQDPGGHEWIVYGPPGVSDLGASQKVEFRQAPAFCAEPKGYWAWLNTTLPRLVRQERIDAVFAATGFGMWSPPCPQAILIRNPIYFSRLYAQRVRDWRVQLDLKIRRWLSLRLIQKSKIVVFPTESMRDMVAHHMDLRPFEVLIAPYGCDQETFQQPSQDRSWFPNSLIQRQGEFLLNVSIYCAQKNLTVLFKALGILARQGEHRSLALTTHLTPAPHCTYREDREILDREHLEDQVFQLGPISRTRLPSLYQSAGIFVFPSYVESFGHPLVEAMAAGLPILAADMPVNREICGAAALYAPPFDSALWAKAIRKLFENPSLREQLRVAGQVRVKHFSWKKHVELVIQVLERIA